jgi:uncharacterized membrane protein YhaH (DUF805 family)
MNFNFGDAVKLGFANYVNFSHRACRSEYWFWYLFAVIGLFATALFDSSSVGRPLTYTFLPSLSVAIRRLHDLDRTGWWILLALIPVVGDIILLIWFCFKGTDGPNRFGADRLAQLGTISSRP